MLLISTFFTFFNMFLNISNRFTAVELHVVQLVIILFHLNALMDLILYYSIYCIIDQSGQNIFLHILSFANPQVKTMIAKLRLLPRKTPISGISFTTFFNTDYPVLW